MATSAVEAVTVGSHEDTSTASLGGTLIAETFNFPITVDLVILQNSQLDPMKDYMLTS